MTRLQYIFNNEYDTFAKDSFQKNYLIIQRNIAEYFEKILDRNAIDGYLENVELKHPDVRIVKEAEAIDTKEYVLSNNVINKKAFFEHFINGATIAFSGLHKSIKSLAILTNELEAETGHKFQTNVYLTPPNSQGFKIHYDSHDVIVLQVGGKKNWKIFDKSPIKWPHHEQKFVAGQFEPGDCIEDFTLHQGDTLYIPRGVWHCAESIGEYSLHITVGFMGTTWGDLINRYVQEQLFTDEKLREYVPFYDLPPAELGAIMHELMSSFTLKDKLGEFIQKYNATALQKTQKPSISNFIEHARKIGELNLETVVERTSKLAFSMSTTKEELTLISGGEQIVLPIFTEEIVRFMLAQQAPIKIADLPNTMDEEGKINLVIHLISKGIFMLTIKGE